MKPLELLRLSFSVIILVIIFNYQIIAVNAVECCYSPPCHYEDNSHYQDCETDFVIIGVGTAGALLAKRLSDPLYGNNDFDHPYPSFGVVGLEWGGYHNNDIEVNTLANLEFLTPSGFPIWSNDITNPPDPGIGGVQSHTQYGRMLGGSGNHNFAYVVHPSPRLLNEDWVAVAGSTWNFTNITDVMNSYETYHGNSTITRGTNGPIQVTQVQGDPNPNTFGSKFFTALHNNLPAPDNNTPIVDDYNSIYNTFINQSPQFFEKTDLIHRSSTGLDFTNTSVLTPDGFGVNGRRLRVQFGALVNKIIFDNHQKAHAVEYTLNGETRIVHVRKRIILTAYTVNSPVILQRSGYGNATLLNSLGIDVVYNNPNVGNNLQNHVGSIYVVASNLSASTGFLSDQAYLSILPEVNGRRLVQILLSPALSSTGSGALDTVLGLNSLPPGWVPYAFYTAVMMPASRGSVQITSVEPSVSPTILSNFYSDPTNRDLRAVERTFQVLHQNLASVRAANPNSVRQIYPPESAFTNNATDLDPYIKGLPFIHQHWAGTLAIGTVVNNQLDLIGVDGVTVADLSVAPVVNDGNTATMAMFVAQKAANILINRYRV